MKHSRSLFSFCLFICVVGSMISIGFGSAITNISIPTNEVFSQQIIFNPVSIGNQALDEYDRKDYFRAGAGEPTLSRISSSEIYSDDTIAVYRADVVFDVPMNVYTTLPWEDVTNEQTITRPWYEYWTYQISFFNDYSWQPSVYLGTTYGSRKATTGYQLNVSFKDYALRSNYLTNPISQYKDLGVNIGIQALPELDLPSKAGNPTHLNFTMYQWQLTGVKAISSSSTVLETYNDEFVQNEFSVSAEITDLANKGQIPEEIPLSSTELKLQAQEAALAKSVGIHRARQYSDEGSEVTAQHDYLAGCVINEPLIKADQRPGIDQNKIVNFPITIRPKISTAVELVTIKKGIAEICTQSSLPGVGPQVSKCESTTTVVPRNIGVRVNNKCLQQRYELAFTLWSSVELTGAPEEKSLLSIPEIERSNMVWDALLTGDKAQATSIANRYQLSDFVNDVQVGQALINSLINWVLPILIGVAVIYIFLKIGIPLINIKSKQLKSK